MANIAILPPQTETRPPDLSKSRPENRPLPLRTYSESEADGAGCDADWSGSHLRRKSAYTATGTVRLNLHRPASSKSERMRNEASLSTQTLSAVQELHDGTVFPTAENPAGGLNALTPPVTPVRGRGTESKNSAASEPDITCYDFSKIDYELDRMRAIGKGLWSLVYLAQPVVKSPQQSTADIPSPPLTPQRKAVVPPCRLFAVKIPARPDAKDVFLQDARILTRLQRSTNAHQYIVPFHGLDARNSSLVFEGVIGGSLENLLGRLKVMTELARHLELRSLFPGLASDLISGLRFIHAAGVIHADLKPANVLLDISEHHAHPNLVIRARYIDFSASFVSEHDSAGNAGGTWDFMAPEQLRIQKDLNTPTFASDVWSLGITLLSIIVGGSPYTVACGNNVFMLREAIKGGDPLGFARMDPVVQKRMAACQDFVDCCRLALQKDRGRRTTAAAWERWLHAQLS